MRVVLAAGGHADDAAQLDVVRVGPVFADVVLQGGLGLEDGDAVVVVVLDGPGRGDVAVWVVERGAQGRGRGQPEGLLVLQTHAEGDGLQSAVEAEGRAERSPAVREGAL